MAGKHRAPIKAQWRWFKSRARRALKVVQP